MLRKTLLTLMALSIWVSPLRAGADELFGEFQRLPDAIERGFSLGTDFGLLYVTKDRRSTVNPGFQLAFTAGYDITKYLSIEGISTFGINEAAAADPVLQGGVNSYQFDLAAKGAFPLGRLYPFVEVGSGIFFSHPSFSPTGENKKLNILISAGFEYYTMLRHYSLYLKATYFYVKLPINAITAAVGLKYTF
jgi:hypothetical protein